MRCRTEVGPDGQQQSVMALVWVNARFRLHLRSPGAACRRPSGVIRPSAPLPSVAARAVRRQTRNKLFGSTRALPASVMCLESLHVCTLLAAYWCHPRHVAFIYRGHANHKYYMYLYGTVLFRWCCKYSYCTHRSYTDFTSRTILFKFIN